MTNIHQRTVSKLHNTNQSTQWCVITSPRKRLVSPACKQLRISCFINEGDRRCFLKVCAHVEGQMSGKNLCHPVGKSQKSQKSFEISYDICHFFPTYLPLAHACVSKEVPIVFGVMRCCAFF